MKSPGSEDSLVLFETGRGISMNDDGFYDELSRLTNDLVNLQRDLAGKTRRLERLGQLKNQILAMATHDLRRPLQAIMAFAELVADMGGLSEEQQELLERIRASASGMSRIVDDLLDLAIVEAGRLELDRDLVELPELLDRVVGVAGVFAARAGVTLAVGQDAAIPRICADSGRLERALANLVINAVEHSRSGSTVELRTSRAGDLVTIEVVDHGEGISSAELARLFEPWERTPKACGERGAGLGLPIARAIVEAHGGALAATSTVGAGSTFTLSLPLTAEVTP